MENPRKTYQVALTYKQYLQNIAEAKLKAKTDLSGLPAIIHEEDTQAFYHVQRNIFTQDTLESFKHTDLSSLKPYHYVGGREVRNYQLKNSTKKRRNVSIAKRATESAISLSRISTIRNNEYQSYLTKEEVIKLFSPYPNDPLLCRPYIEGSSGGKNNSNPQSDQPKNGSQECLRNKSSNSQESKAQFESSNEPTLKAVPIASVREAFAALEQCRPKVSKLKENYQRYADLWNCQSQKRAQLSHGNKHPPQRSVLEHALHFRQTVELQNKNDLKMKCEHVSPELWAGILRQSINLSTLYDGQAVPHIERSKIQVRGRNKLEKETEWLQEASRQGCFFKADNVDKAKMEAQREPNDLTKC